LILLANDDNYSDNSGSFSAQIRVTSGLSTSTQTGGSAQTGSQFTVNVPANDPDGTDTGVDLRRGDRVTVSASGSIYVDDRSGRITPDGNRSFSTSRSSYPLPDAGQGALIGYIRLTDGRTTRPFQIGSQQSFNVPDDGRLFLLVNDDDYRDNSGNFSVRVSY
jgi:hypothetical protein